jgi:hypothetical protein
MSDIDVRPLASVPVEPWRNGGGVTQTLATNRTRWRVSLAQVERDGPYSRFDGVTRVSFVLRGNGVVLEDGATTVRLRPHQAVEYDGGQAWNARLVDGPVTALNVMSAAGRCRTTVIALVDAIVVPPGCAAIVVALGSECRYSEPGLDKPRSIGVGQIMVASHLDRPLRIEPALRTTAAGREVELPLLVTIEPATAGTTE